MNTFWKSIGYIVLIHLLCLAAMSLCRVLLLLTNLPAESIDWALLTRAMLIGVKFDNLVACYTAALPLLVTCIYMLVFMHCAWFKNAYKHYVNAVAWYYGIVYTLVLFIEVANARYYHFFENHLTISVTDWFGFAGTTAGMIFQDKGNVLFFMVALVLIMLYWWAVFAVAKERSIDEPDPTALTYVYGVLSTVLLAGLCFCGMRSSFQRFPLQVSFAYFCDKPFYNRLGVNPIVSIINSMDYKRDEIPAFLVSGDEYTQDDICRPMTPERVVSVENPNVVLVLMESMSSINLTRSYNNQPLTPYLNSLQQKAQYWSNCFSAGIHTNNGIVASMYGYMPNFANTIMGQQACRFTGLPYWLRRNGYETLCFITSHPQYDNMNSFWRDNNIETIYSLYDYPSSAAVNNFGVQDDYMFSFAVETLSKRSSGKPFFATLLTVSNHAPFVVPEEYKDCGSIDDERMIAYADDAVRQFVEAAQQTEWGRNTVFVLVADHGTPLKSPYEMVLTYNTIPVFIFGCGVPVQEISHPTMQADIYPTVLSLLGIPFTNNCLGEDVLHEQRPYSVFVSNEHLGCSDGEYFYCYSLTTGLEKLYHIGSSEDLSQTEPERTAAMRNYAKRTQYLNLLSMQNKWTEP